MPFDQGPYLKAACFCERVLREQDGVLTLVRIIDRLNQTVAGPDAPSEMPTLTYKMFAVILLVSGPARGNVELKIQSETPSGIKGNAFATSVLMEGEDRGQHLVMEMDYTFNAPGLYWFDVFLDDVLMTRMPFRVTFTRLSSGTQRSQ